MALHLFSGPRGRVDGLEAHLHSLGWGVVEIDITHKDSVPLSECDLLNDQLWQRILADVQAGTYSAIWLGTPCTTFSRALGRPLRSVDHPYGLPPRSGSGPAQGLTREEVQRVREGTYFAFRSWELFGVAVATGIPVALENPEPWPGHPSIFELPEARAVLALPGVGTFDFDQCPMGAVSPKPTRVAAFRLDLAGLLGRCDHPPRWCSYVCAHTGQDRQVWARHPPIRGARALGGSGFATKEAAAYPGEMYSRIAATIAASSRG